MELMKDADLALYRAKAAGRNIAVTYDPSMRVAMAERVTISREIADALEEGRILPFYQPQISLSSGRVVGLEALARWKHPSRGIVPAAAFQRAFEDAEIARGIGDAVLAAAIADMRGWLAAGLEPPTVYVNLAPSAFRESDPAGRVLAAIERGGIAPSRIGVEVSETLLVARGARDVERALVILREAGVRVALDDFGTGLASLTRLERFPIDALKIDRGFVRDIESIGASAAIVRAVIGFAVDLDRAVIAEGVETPGQEAFLRQAGCDIVQGYRYARPVMASRVSWLLSQPSLLPNGRPHGNGNGNGNGGPGSVAA
jgi:EAL domain-containing protein (putative c-di-GMP-specific phosphodiesterase class I)